MVYTANLAVMVMGSLVNVAQVSNIYRLIPGANRSAEFVLSWELESAAYTTSTTTGDPCAATLIIEHSPDQSSWVELKKEIHTAATTSKNVLSVTTLLPYVRVRTVLGGSTAPTHKTKVYLLSNESFLVQDAGPAPAQVTSKTRVRQVTVA